jgi:hypothetical protein
VDVDGRLRATDGGVSEIVDDVLFENYTRGAASDYVLSEDGDDVARRLRCERRRRRGADHDGNDVWAMAAWHRRALLCVLLFF